jgi:cell division septum initiation protein DivIVA
MRSVASRASVDFCLAIPEEGSTEGGPSSGGERHGVMDVLVLIEKLDDLVHNARPVPLTDQVRVDKEEIHDILDEMRATISEEVKQARWMVKEREEMLTEAKGEAARIVAEAGDWQERLLSTVATNAERAADDIIADARARERQMRLGAQDYANEILDTLEVELSKFSAAVQRGRDRLTGSEEHARFS